MTSPLLLSELVFTRLLFTKSVFTRLLLAALLLTGLARASTPELFQADPAMLNDYTASLPSHGSTGGYEYEIIQGLAIFEGDILLGNVDSDGNIPGKIRTRGLARNDAFGRWPDGIVPYMAPTRNSPLQQLNIALAIEHWMELSSITFVELDEENKDQYPHYLRFASSNGCASYVGMQGGEQPIMVSDGCTIGSIVHEIGHALGLFHEHTRSDRDSFVQIDWDQIVSGKDINFKLQDIGTTDYGVYDYGSIMHYGEYFFSKSTQPTIRVPDGVEIGQRLALSDTDAASVNEMYATDLALLPPSDMDTSDTGGELAFGLTVLNQGSLGAHDVQLVLRLADDTRWQGVSEDSGWECLVYSPELRCTLPTLTEGTESRFEVFAEPGSASADDLRLLLTSRTADTDTTNNRVNDDGSLTAEPANDEGTPIAADGPVEVSAQEGETPISVVVAEEPDTQIVESPDTSDPEEEPDTQPGETTDTSTPDEEPTVRISEIPFVSVPDLQGALPVSEAPAPPEPEVQPDTATSDTPDTSNQDTGNQETGDPDSGNPDSGNPDSGAASYRVAASDTTAAAAAGAVNASLFLVLAALIGWRRSWPIKGR